MKNLIKRMAIILALFATITLLPGAGTQEDATNAAEISDCLTVTPSAQLDFGERYPASYYDLSVTMAGTWGAWVTGSWIQLQILPSGGVSGTLSSGGNQTVRVTVSPGTHPCPTTLTGSITFYGGSCGNVVIPVQEHYCPCC